MLVLVNEDGKPLEGNTKDVRLLPGSTIYFQLHIKTTSLKENFKFFIRPRNPADYSGTANPEFDFNALVNYSYDDNCGIFIFTGSKWERISPEQGISPETAITLNNGALDTSMMFTANFRVTVPPVTKQELFSVKGLKSLNFVFRGE